MMAIHITPDELIRRTCKIYGVKKNDICGSDRRRSMVNIRRSAAALMRAWGFSLPEIGRALNRHHTSILWLLRGGRRKG